MTPLKDIREVDSPFKLDEWINNIKPEVIKDNKPEVNIKPEIDNNKTTNNDDIVKVYDRTNPEHIFLCRRQEIEELNSRLQYTQFVIIPEYNRYYDTHDPHNKEYMIKTKERDNLMYGKLPTSSNFVHCGVINNYPHPSNHEI